MATLTFVQKVAKIQRELKAPKNQRNKFGNYNYRNQEDILEALKPLLGDLVLTVSDDIVEVGGRVYVKATSTLTDGDGNTLSNVAFAREPNEQKGMSEPQLTGSASSYARKYSLNGLFLIDDTKDADTEEFQGKKSEAPAQSKPQVDAAAIVASVEKEVNEVVQAAAPKAAGGWANKKKTNAAPSAGDLY